MLKFQNGEWIEVDVSPLLSIEGDNDSGGGEGTDDVGGQSNDGQVGDDDGSDDDGAASTGKQDKPDWRVEKYGEDWENTAAYWKDNASYAWEQYKGERSKRQKQVPLEELKTETDKAAGSGGTNGDARKAEISTVQELLEHVNKQNEQLLESRLSQRDKDLNFRNSMQKARREIGGDPDNGIPSFAELEQEVLIPLVQKNPKVLALLREMDGDPAENAYTLAIVVKSRNIDGLRSMFERKGREDFAKKLDDVSKEAVRLKSGKAGATSVKLSPDDIWSMSKDKFEEHVARQTGKI